MNLKLPPAVRIFIVSLIAIPLMLCFIPAKAVSKRDHLVYFPDTAYELNIYKIFGKNPGKTLMLIGGIQGNEPGGFLSADLYADMRLEKGNLIVVPRANFYSIILNHRGAHGDMNRKFTPQDNSLSMEDRIVTILKGLISESDYLLNLHDGAGYYYPDYIDKWRNPNRFGQSIIADCHEYLIPGSDKTIKLGEMAEKITQKVNQDIENELYKFHFMNTRTDEKDSIHKEQRKSATYYALTEHHIPAFGVETSKFLPSIDLKVRYHNMIINTFMDMFGIIPQSPGLALEQPVLKYIVVSINGETSIVVDHDQSLNLNKGDYITVSHIEANYERGLSLDILGYGDLNDFRKKFQIFRNTNMIIRKDNHQFGEIPIHLSQRRAIPKTGEKTFRKLEYFIIQVNGNKLLLENNGILNLVRGEKIKIIDVLPSELTDITVNFKGFVGDKKNNTGEDRGYEINTGSGLMKRYSINNKGEIYPIIVSRGDEEIGRLSVKLSEPKMEYLVMGLNGETHLLIRADDSISLKTQDKICMEEIMTNLQDESDLRININGYRIKKGDKRRAGDICKSGNNKLEIKNGPILIGRVNIEMEK